MKKDEELLKAAQEALADYFRLSAMLFGEDAPNDVNEIAEDSPFLGLAKAISDEMGLDWGGMSHEDSNRVMLNMLADKFAAASEAPAGSKPWLTVSFRKEA